MIKSQENPAKHQFLHRTGAITLFVLALIAVFPGCSGSNVTPREGSLTGRILNTSGQPIEDALVTWSYDNTRWALTDSNGNYYIQGIGFGEQIFQVDAFGYRSTQFKASIYSGQTTSAADLQIEAKSFDYSEIKVEEVSATHALITWKTTDYTNGVIEYGETESLGRTVREESGEYSTSHSLKLTGLSPQKLYYFKIVSSRENRAAETSIMSSFTTASTLEDKTPPSPPANVEAALTSSPNMVTVFWAPVSDLDLKGYKVYRAENANTAFSEVSNILIAKGQERFTDVSVTPGKKYYYRVTAVDQSGNESGFHNIASMLVPGDVASQVTWTRANSPYVIAGDITVHETGRINIDAGVEILIADYDSFRRNDPDKIDIIVSGAIVASSSSYSPVIFAANTSNPGKDFWNGILFQNVENPANTLVNVKISDARQGIRIKNSVGVFSEIEILNCETAIKCESTNDLTISNLLTKRCLTGAELVSNRNLTLSSSTFYHPTICINSSGNDGIKIEKCNFLEFTDTGLISNEAGGTIVFTNNLFVAPNGTGIKVLSHNPSMEYNTFDVPYAIQITQGNPIIRKNLFMADRSVFSTGQKGIEHLNGTLPLPVFGPNNMYGFDAGKDYIGCTATADSSKEDVLLMKEITGDTYDYRLRQPFPTAEDPWGIQRMDVPFKP
ncbi:MAG: hypothetical protein Kow0029_16320 [Candidatus Rifleibacteriota bacterium]